MESVEIHGEFPQPYFGEDTYSFRANPMAADAQDFLTSISGGKSRFPFINVGEGIGKCQTLIQWYLQLLEEQVNPDPFWQILNWQRRRVHFSFDEVLRAIEQ